MSWNPPKNLLFPWITSLAEQLKAARLPAMSGSTLWISSDYSFDNRQIDFDVIGLLLADPDNSPNWESLRRSVRREYFADGRRIAWKKLGDKKRQDAFFPFLQAADNIHGVLVAIAIERRPEFRFSTKQLRGYPKSGIVVSPVNLRYFLLHIPQWSSAWTPRPESRIRVI